MNTRLIASLAAVLLGAAPVAATAQGAAAPVRIRLGTLVPQGTSYHRILQTMGEAWRTATNGRVQTTVYAGTMGSEGELVRRLRLGQLQAATLSGVGMKELEPGIGAVQSVPMLFRSIAELEFVMSRIEADLNRRLYERGFVVLFWADAGWVRFFSRTAATRPDEFRRMKLFITAGETEEFDIMRSAGYQPVALEWTDALTSLQTGMIDALETIPFYALAGQFYTVASHMLELNWAPLIGATVVSRRTWESLPEETRTALRAAAVASGREFKARALAEAEESVAAMRQRGLVVHPVTPAVEQEWRTVAETFYPRIRGTMAPADMFDQVQRLLAEYRARPPAR